MRFFSQENLNLWSNCLKWSLGMNATKQNNTLLQRNQTENHQYDTKMIRSASPIEL